MKRLFSLFYIMCTGAAIAVAQDSYPKHEFRIGLSDALPLTIGDALLHGFTSALTSGISGYSKDTKNENSSGMWGIGYKYHINNRFSAGLELSYMASSKDINFKKSDDEYTVHRKSSFFLVLPTAQYHYLNREKLQLYGNIGVGLVSYTIKEEKNIGPESFDNNYISLAFQVNPIGLRIGQKFGGFAELGFGYKGIIHAGASMRF